MLSFSVSTSVLMAVSVTSLLCDNRMGRYSKSATHLCTELLQTFILINTPTAAAIFSWTSSVWCLTYFLPVCLVCVKEKKNTNGVTVFQSARLFWGEKEQSPGTYVAWNVSGGRVTLSARFLHLVCWLQSVRAGWLDRRGLWGHCVYGEGMERCAEWITFPGNSCQIHQSRAEDRRAGPARPNPDTRLIGVDGTGGGCGPDCLPASNAGLKGFDGWPHRATWRGSQHPGSFIV